MHSIDLCCAVLTDRADTVDWVALNPAMWQSFADHAAAHGVAPLICHVFNEHGWPAPMPAAVRLALLRVLYTETAASALLHAELRRVLAALHETGPLVLLKGAALGTTAYPRPALRPMCDLDLLVRRGALPAAMSALAMLGYEATPEIAPGIHQAIEHHEHLEGGPQRSVGLDLHWNLIAGDADWRTPPIDWFWQQTEPWRVADAALRAAGNVRQLTPIAHVLYLAAHLMLQHCGEQARLIWFYDLHLLINQHHERIAWDELVQRAIEFGWSAALLAALEATVGYFQSPVPLHVFTVLRARPDDRATIFVQRKARAARMASEWINILALQPLVRWRVLRRVIVPSPQYIRWRYRTWHTWLWPLAYVWHWLRLGHTGGRALLRAGSALLRSLPRRRRTA